MSFGGNSFILRVRWEICSIEVTVTSSSSSAATVASRVKEQVDKVIADSMHSLRYCSLVPLPSTSQSNFSSSSSTSNSGVSVDSLLFVPVDRLSEWAKVGSLSGAGKRDVLSSAETARLLDL